MTKSPEIKIMSLDGLVNKEIFLDEWNRSVGKRAIYVQTKGTIYIMPAGGHSIKEPDVPSWKASPPAPKTNVKFTGTDRDAPCVIRDFEISDQVTDAGYLVLIRNGTDCLHIQQARGYPFNPNRDRVSAEITLGLLPYRKQSKS